MVGNPSAVMFRKPVLNCPSLKVGESWWPRQSLVTWIQGPTSQQIPFWRESWEVFISTWRLPWSLPSEAEGWESWEGLWEEEILWEDKGIFKMMQNFLFDSVGVYWGPVAFQSLKDPESLHPQSSATEKENKIEGTKGNLRTSHPLQDRGSRLYSLSKASRAFPCPSLWGSQGPPGVVFSDF